MSIIKPNYINLCEGNNHAFVSPEATVCLCGKEERKEKENMIYTIDNHKHEYIFNDDEQFIQPECKHCGLLKSTIEARPEPHQAEGLNEKIKQLSALTDACPVCVKNINKGEYHKEHDSSHPQQEKCGAIIHVGFEGNTTCANSKPCPIRSHKPVDSIQPKGKFCMAEECDGDGIEKVPGGHVHAQPPAVGKKVICKHGIAKTVCSQCPKAWTGTKEEMKHLLETSDARGSGSFWTMYGDWIRDNMPEEAMTGYCIHSKKAPDMPQKEFNYYENLGEKGEDSFSSELVETLEELFPKGKCKERTAALVLNAYANIIYLKFKSQAYERGKEEARTEYAESLKEIIEKHRVQEHDHGTEDECCGFALGRNDEIDKVLTLLGYRTNT